MAVTLETELESLTFWLLPKSAAPQHSSSKLDSAFGLHDCCNEPSAPQESAPKKKATRKSAKKESK